MFDFGVGDFDRAGDSFDRAEVRVRQVQDHIVFGDLRVGEGLLHGIDRGAGDLALEQVQPFGGGLLAGPFLEQGYQFIAVGEAMLKAVKARVVGECGRAEDAHQLAVELFLGAHDHQPAVLCWQHL